MKLKKTFWALALAGASLAIPALADSNLLHVHVPFAFVAGGRKLPAGTYNLWLSESGQIIFVLGPGESSMVNGVPTGVMSGDAKPSLVFKRFGADEYLVGIQAAEIGSRSIPLKPLQ